MSFISSSMDPLFTSSQNDTVNYIFYLYYKNIILLYNKLSLYINIYIYLIQNYNKVYSSQRELSFTPTIEMGIF